MLRAFKRVEEQLVLILILSINLWMQLSHQQDDVATGSGPDYPSLN